MKNIFYLIIAFLLSASSIEAQTTEGREFWVTFGQNAFATAPTTIDALDLRIRIVGGGASTFVNIYFTNLGTYGLIDHEIEPYEVYRTVFTSLDTGNRANYAQSFDGSFCTNIH